MIVATTDIGCGGLAVFFDARLAYLFFYRFWSGLKSSTRRTIIHGYILSREDDDNPIVFIIFNDAYTSFSSFSLVFVHTRIPSRIFLEKMCNDNTKITSSLPFLLVIKENLII